MVDLLVPRDLSSFLFLDFEAYITLRYSIFMLFISISVRSTYVNTPPLAHHMRGVLNIRLVFVPTNN